jgi:hypothetical protein
MKKVHPADRRKDRGFALVATLMLLVLLALLAVGLLSLSAVTLRSASQGSAQNDARGNARLALMIAIGELQESMGPDRRISATSEILATSTTPPVKPNLTGVWESWWDFNPNAAPSYNAEKTSRFRRWLVSNADEADLESRDFVTTAWTGKTIELAGSGSLGASATAADKVTAGLVPVSKNGKVQGAYAWHVSDESVKARINLFRDPGQNTTLAQKRALLAGHRPDPSVMRDPDGNLLTCLPADLTQAQFIAAKSVVGKVTDLSQAELLDGANGKIKPLRNDITPYSLGVMADVRGGGLKQDLSSVFEMGSAAANTLPAEFTDEKLYQSTHGITGVSDPNWSALAGYYNSFRSLTTPDGNPTLAVKLDPVATDPVPAGYNLAPVISKVETIFSLIGRPVKDVNWMYGGGRPGSAGEKYDYFVNMIFTPMVTLHNPYNVNLSFYSMNVEFVNIPVAFNFMFQSASAGPFVSQSMVPGTFESLNNMTYNRKRGNKTFVMKIADWTNAKSVTVPAPDTFDINGPIVMKPGQTLVFSPYFSTKSNSSNSAASFYEDSKNVAGQKTVAFDWNSHMTGEIKAKAVFVPGVGFETCLITPSHTPINSWNHHLLLRDANSPYNTGHPTDRFYVEFKVQQPSWYRNNLPNTTRTLAAPSFEVNAELQADAASAPVKYTSLKFDYANEPNSKNIKDLYNDRVYRYPPAPNDSLTGGDVAAPNRESYATQGSYVHPLAIFSAYARTTNGGVYETGKRDPGANSGNSSQINILQDGRLAGKPFLFHNVSRSNFTMDLTTEKPAARSYELNFQPFLSKGDFQDYMDVDINRVPSLSGNRTTSGIKSGSYLELPSGPLQTVADFRRSNALSTTYQPHFVQPVGNSLLHPLMSADKVIETNTDISATQLLDHSVLANHALYDRFYFSTFATRGATKPDAVFEQFMNGSAPLALQAFQPHLPGGKTVSAAKADLFASGIPKDTAYMNAAEYLMIRGPFNVNSTSVQAWKAVLASMNKSDVITLWARNSQLEATTAGGVAIPAMSLLNGGVIGSAVVDSAEIDNVRTNDWNGYRELTETELENLAEKIVAEVRERGPFLSMSEFVNRQVGPTGPLTLRGALDAAIAKAEINEEEGAVFPDTFLDQVPIAATDVSDPKLYSYKTPDATTGNPAAGAPGWVSQGDLLRILEPSATVRGDTFVIRAYGEAQDANGNITARAYAEAVVQRMPEYVDPSDRPSINAYSEPTAAAANKVFGRRISVVSFRWLSHAEI